MEPQTLTVEFYEISYSGMNLFRVVRVNQNRLNRIATYCELFWVLSWY